MTRSVRVVRSISLRNGVADVSARISGCMFVMIGVWGDPNAKL